MNVGKIRKAVLSLQVQQSTVGNDRVLLDEVLMILDEAPEYWRPDSEVMERLVSDERKRQQRVKNQRSYDPTALSEISYGRRGGEDRRHHE